MPRVANSITRAEAIQLDLSIDRNEPEAKSRDRGRVLAPGGFSVFRVSGLWSSF
jgi:hypothetical protein